MLLPRIRDVDFLAENSLGGVTPRDQLCKGVGSPESCTIYSHENSDVGDP